MEASLKTFPKLHW